MKVKPAHREDKLISVQLKCPGCEHFHAVPISPEALANGATWKFTGDFDNPTLTPSVKITMGPFSGHFGEKLKGKTIVCHFNLTNGNMQFHGDCTHHLKGKTIPLPEYAEAS